MDINKALRTAIETVTVHVGTKESFKAANAGTAKLIIISSNCPTGPSEILDSGKGGFLFRVENFKDLGDKILIYKKQKTKCEKLKKFALKRLERFNFKKIY